MTNLSMNSESKNNRVLRQAKTTAAPTAPRPRTTHPRRHNPNHKPRIDDLVVKALDFINKHADNKTVYKCFNKRNNALSTFGVYNYITKKYSLHHVTNFYPEDLMDIKLVALEKV